MKVINIFGGPGAGKSTTAAGLFHLMKLRGDNVELVTEVAKDFVWEQRTQCLNDQLFITASQNHRLERLRDKVDWVITDSPILLGLIYAPLGYYNHYGELVLEVFNSYDNINIYLNRIKPYFTLGRLQTESESDAIGKMINDKLNAIGESSIMVNGDEDAPNCILKVIEK